LQLLLCPWSWKNKAHTEDGNGKGMGATKYTR
jgi:hypothetical protein